MTDETIKNLLPKFLENLEEKGRSPSTILAYRSDLEQLMKYLQTKSKVLPNQVRLDDLEAFRDFLLSQKYTAKSVSRKLNAIKTFFSFLIDQKTITHNPSADVAHPKIELTLPEFLSPIQYRALRDVVRGDIRIAAIVELILQTGLRISEVANLKQDGVRGPQITVEAYASQPKRVIPLNKSAAVALAAYMKVRPKTDAPFVFVSKNGKPVAVRNIRAAIDRYMQRAETPNFSVNDLRTTFIVENLKAGVDIVYLASIVGHKRISTTERYLELAGRTEPGKEKALIEL